MAASQSDPGVVVGILTLQLHYSLALTKGIWGVAEPMDSL